MKILKHPVISEVPSDDMPAPGIIRAPRGTNPVNASKSGKRETTPLEPLATPRMKHPKLNKESWTTSYAQSRSEPRMARPKARMRRQRRERRGR
jgi:hypothetical protein